MTWQLQKIASENDVVFLCDANLFLVSVLWRSDDGLTSTSDGGVSRFPVILKPLMQMRVSRFVAGVRKERDMSRQPTKGRHERGRKRRPHRERYRTAISLADTIARRSAAC